MVLNFQSECMGRENELLIYPKRPLILPIVEIKIQIHVPFSKSAKMLKFLDLEQKLSMKEIYGLQKVWTNLNEWIKERNLKPLQILKVEH